MDREGLSMDDTISRQAAISLAGDLQIHGVEYHMYNQALINYCAELTKLPSAQPEIIRCKDCKKNPHWEWVGCPMTGKDTRKPDDYCSYAERREE